MGDEQIERRVGEVEKNMTRLLVIAENHTVQIGLMMKAAVGTAGFILICVLGTVLAKVLNLHIVGG